MSFVDSNARLDLDLDENVHIKKKIMFLPNQPSNLKKCGDFELLQLWRVSTTDIYLRRLPKAMSQFYSFALSTGQLSICLHQK